MKKVKFVLAGLVALVVMMTTVLSGCGGSKKVVDTSSETSGEVVWWGWTPGSPTNENRYFPCNR